MAASAPAVKLRVATYNVHKCRGLDRRVRPGRIAEVLKAANAEVVALQEVLSLCGADPEHDQPRFIAAELAMRHFMGENRHIRGAAYGNATLTSLPIRGFQNYDLTWKRNERRGCLRTDIEIAPGRVLHVFNVHLGTAWLERRHQARRLIAEVLSAPDLSGPRILVGDFNEWTRGLATRLLSEHMHAVDIRPFLRRSRTYPGIFPLLHIDHIYFDPPLRLESVSIVRSRLSLVASDHLPLIAEFSWKAAADQRR